MFDFFSFMAGGIVGAVAIRAIVSILDQLHATDESATNDFVGRTTVELRETEGVNAQRWTARVRYDSWGAPYIPYSSFAGRMEQSIYENGKTSNTYLYGTQWRHVSGPPVSFGKRPSSGNAFEEKIRS